MVQLHTPLPPLSSSHLLPERASPGTHSLAASSRLRSVLETGIIYGFVWERWYRRWDLERRQLFS